MPLTSAQKLKLNYNNVCSAMCIIALALLSHTHTNHNTNNDYVIILRKLIATNFQNLIYFTCDLFYMRIFSYFNFNKL